MMLEAGQAEILRAAQRDESYKKYFRENISEILQSLFGIHFWIKYKELIERLSNVLYQFMTTMSNLQTLGEEYTGMVQVDQSRKSLPKKHLQLVMILLNNFGERALIDGLQKFVKTIENLPEEHPLQHSARLELIKMSNTLKVCLPFFLKFHKVLFYFNGHYYELSKRLCGIRYVLVRYWLKDRSSLPAFKLLGIVTLIQSLLSFLLTFSNVSHSNPERTQEFRSSEDSEACDKCSLCLNARQNASVTPCGHLFCWSCILQWLQEQPKCPLCRQAFQPSRVVFLQNYKVLPTLQVARWNHYRALGLTPSATLAEVKAAYYKLSKMYHPDRNNGSEASAKKFRDIVAAYEVLGKAELRRQYDREVLRKYEFMNADGRKRKAAKRIKKTSGKMKAQFKGDFQHGSSKHRSMSGRGKGMSRCHQEEIENFIVRAIPFVVACLMCYKKRQ